MRRKISCTQHTRIKSPKILIYAVQSIGESLFHQKMEALQRRNTSQRTVSLSLPHWIATAHQQTNTTYEKRKRTRHPAVACSGRHAEPALKAPSRTQRLTYRRLTNWEQSPFLPLTASAQRQLVTNARTIVCHIGESTGTPYNNSDIYNERTLRMAPVTPSPAPLTRRKAKTTSYLHTFESKKACHRKSVVVVSLSTIH